MSELPVNEPLEMVLDEPQEALAALAAGEDATTVARHWPACLAAWASLGDAALEGGRTLDAYAYYRVGYHRGLDRLRGAGWRGRGRVPSSHAANRGFLRSLRGLGLAAGELGEHDEAARCEDFLVQLAPEWH
jgi:hypothetical protein